MYAHIEQEFIEKQNTMKEKYEDHLGFLTYSFEDEIICPHWYKLIRFYTKQVIHFGNTSTSRAKILHVKLKANLVSFIGIHTSKF